jgi:hypothetical protein
MSGMRHVHALCIGQRSRSLLMSLQFPHTSDHDRCFWRRNIHAPTIAIVASCVAWSSL